MSTRPATIVALADMVHGQESDLFVLLKSKDELKTRDGKTYHKVTFRDARREVSFPIWSDSPWAEACRKQWRRGYFISSARRIATRPTDRSSTFARFARWWRPTRPKVSIRGCSSRIAIRPGNDVHRAAGDRCRDQESGLGALVLALLDENREPLLSLPAATRNHHAYYAGYLEHVLSVTRTAVYLADKYAEYYSDMRPPLDRDLVIAGAVLHDIGKLREIAWQPEGAEYTAAGRLVGHILQGRDIVREAAARYPLEGDLLLRLEHIIIAHQRLPEWGSPKPPMTRETHRLLCRRHRREGEHDVHHAPRRHDPRPADIEKESAFSTHLSRTSMNSGRR